MVTVTFYEAVPRLPSGWYSVSLPDLLRVRPGSDGILPRSPAFLLRGFASFRQSRPAGWMQVLNPRLSAPMTNRSSCNPTAICNQLHYPCSTSAGSYPCGSGWSPTSRFQNILLSPYLIIFEIQRQRYSEILYDWPTIQVVVYDKVKEMIHVYSC